MDHPCTYPDLQSSLPLFIVLPPLLRISLVDDSGQSWCGGRRADSEGYDDDEGSFAVIMVAKVKMAAPTAEGSRAFFAQLKRQKMKQRKGAHFLGPWHAKK